jgi:hemoglobin
MKGDINNRSDVEKFVNAFFKRLMNDDEFNYIFSVISGVEILSHLDAQYNFWESAIFQNKKYKEDVLHIHLELHLKYKLNQDHFNKWLILFNETVDALFYGKNASKAKEKALSVLSVIKMKIDNLEKRRLEINN